MRALHLDYQARKPVSRAGVLLLAVAIAAAGASLWQFSRLRQEQARWEAQGAQSQARLGRDAASRSERAPGPRSAEEAAAANAVIRRLAFPWQEMFAAFETTAGADVALLGIEPDTAKGVVKVTAESKTPKGMLNYVRRLQGSAFLDEVVLQKHEVRNEDPDRPVRFMVVARWKYRD